MLDSECTALLKEIHARLDRLELIESHLLDLLLPHRKQYLRHIPAKPNPIPVLAAAIKASDAVTNTVAPVKGGAVPLPQGPVGAEGAK